MEKCGTWPYMISFSSQWELARISSTLLMWRRMGLLSVRMQRQCFSTPRLLVLLRLLPARANSGVRPCGCTQENKCIEKKTKIMHTCEQNLTFSHCHEGQENHKRGDVDFAAHHIVAVFFFPKRRWMDGWIWNLKKRRCPSKSYLMKLKTSQSRLVVLLAWAALLFECSTEETPFILSQMSHFPRSCELRKIGEPRGIHRVRCLTSVADLSKVRPERRLSFGKTQVTKNLSWNCCVSKSWSKFLKPETVLVKVQ